jgi:hypothetical protein
VLAIDAGEVSMPILLNGRPFCRLVLGQAVKVDLVNANCKCQDRQYEYDQGFPITANPPILNLIQHGCSGLRRERDWMIALSNN